MATLLVGLTGRIGTGKSVVAEVFGTLGATVVSGDELGRAVIESSPELLTAVRARFGDGVFEADGTLRRRALGERVFSSRENTEWLTRLTFPGIHARWRAAAEQCEGVAVFDAALIFEWGIESEFDVLVVVTASRDLVRQRLAHDGRLTGSEFDARFAAQTSPTDKTRGAQVVIENNGSLDQLRATARCAWMESIISELEQRRRKQDDSKR